MGLGYDHEHYWAQAPTTEIGGHLVELRDQYYSHLEKTGHWTLLQHAHMIYYNASYTNGRLRRSGENMEYVEIWVNHYRNLLQHILSLVTSQRPQFEPKAANTDYESLAQTQLASGLLDYYMRMKKIERYIKMATETAINYGEAWLYVGWNATSGDQYGINPETKTMVYEGDIEIEHFNPVDVIRDTTRPDVKQKWLSLRRFKNKFDLMAKYPDLAERIRGVRPERYEDLRFSFREAKEERKDDIPVFTFFHDRTEALPNGRIVEYIDSDIILADGPLPYREVPVYRIAPGEKTGSIFGFSNVWDLLPLQQAMNKLHSTVVTNQAAFGVQNIGVPKGSDMNVVNLSGGLNLIEYDVKLGPPVPINLTQTPKEIFDYMAVLERTMETLSGVNSVARGNPEQSLKSGSALALVQSMAIQFSESLQQSYAQLLEDVGTAIIVLLRDYAAVPRIALIAGKSNRSKMKQFKGDDLQYINRVLVDMGNPLMRTVAGRVNIAEQMINAGQISNPKEYLDVITGGKLEPLYEGDLAELNLVRSENEAMMDGKPVPTIRTDDHALHIQEHKTLLASPEARQQTALVAGVLQHIQEHEAYLQPGAPTQANQGQPAGNVAPTLNAAPPVVQQANGVKLPGMPNMPKMPNVGGR